MRSELLRLNGGMTGGNIDMAVVGSMEGFCREKSESEVRFQSANPTTLPFLF